MTGVVSGIAARRTIIPAITRPTVSRRGVRVSRPSREAGICMRLHPMLMQVRMITPMPRSILKYFSATGRNPGRSPPSISAVKWAAERTATRVPEAWNAVGTTLCFFIKTRETATAGSAGNCFPAPPAEDSDSVLFSRHRIFAGCAGRGRRRRHRDEGVGRRTE